MIEVKRLTKSFQNHEVLKDVDLTVKKGSIYGLIGANGSGKTTLIKHLVGIYRQDSGEVMIDTEKVFENNLIKKCIGYIPDDLYYFPMSTIRNMASFYKKMYPNWNEERYINMLHTFELDENRRIAKLSKGMQKQVAFILTLSTMPKVMILDEPIDGLDPLMRKKVWKYIVKDVAERDISVLISSHNLKELESICDYVGILNKGQMLIERDLDDLKSDIHKIQVVYKKEVPEELTKNIHILHQEKRGTVHLFIVKGNQDKIVSNFNEYHPMILDILPLTLEEIFIYELGGVGYEIQNVIF
ncbi:ABC transporter ATP-binding protein [Crassaminicella profunda]|uniref:ABC transporter ATP-binding protein n=1 Tax=Crassaminicella profunda TaxID=1286698 RepID=UPI001CA63450|nr:ABC transporter ATP-binding protein [Crassaminicella profunda]QZY55944.1 ABC transporter ATP-binding protein [Crassaminicella profunda]